MKALLLSLFAFLAVSVLGISNIHAQTLTLKNLIVIYGRADLRLIDRYLTDLGWKAGKSNQTESVGQVIWVRKHPNNSVDDNATLSVLFCNSCSNKFCPDCAAHDDSSGRGHAFRIIYRPISSQAFLQIKRSAEMKNMVSTTSLHERNLRVAYVGTTYELDLNTYSQKGRSSPEYLIELVQKPK